jgi:hypothetical protein
VKEGNLRGRGHSLRSDGHRSVGPKKCPAVGERGTMRE